MQGIGKIEGALNLRLVTGEFEILSWLFKHGPTRSRELSMCTKVSIANFQIILRRLKEENLIVSEPDAADRRVRLFDLSPHVRDEFENWLNESSAARSLLGAANGFAGAHSGMGASALVNGAQHSN